MQAQPHTNTNDTSELELVPVPGMEQVAPAPERRIPLILAVLGNVLVGSLLLGGLFLMPAVMAGWFVN